MTLLLRWLVCHRDLLLLLWLGLWRHLWLLPHGWQLAAASVWRVEAQRRRGCLPAHSGGAMRRRHAAERGGTPCGDSKHVRPRGGAEGGEEVAQVSGYLQATQRWRQA